MHASQQVLDQLHLDPSVPDEVLNKVQECVRRGNVQTHTIPFEARLDEVYAQIVNLNVHQNHIDHNQPVGDNINMCVELLLEAAEHVENLLENMGGAKAICSPIEGISARGEYAVQTAYLILYCISNWMGDEGRSMDTNPLEKCYWSN